MKLLPIENEPGSLIFECPGCKSSHKVQTAGNQSPQWTYNGNPDKPTFSPSIRVRYFYGEEMLQHICHSFVTDGNIQFLSDCTHELAGQTVELPEL